MLSLFYILVSFYIGNILCQNFLGFIEKKLTPDIAPWFRFAVNLPLGFIFTTSWVYLWYFIFRPFEDPLLLANLTLIIPLALFLFFYFPKWSKEPCWYSKRLSAEVLFLFFILVIGILLFYHSIYYYNDHVVIGASVQSDFGPHTAMIRSFSLGKNIPTNYPLFPSDGVRYHFFFYFLVGNLEYLGLSLPQALNIPSVLTFVSAFFLFFLWIKIITRSNLIAWFTIIFFLFRSSPAFPYKIFQILKHKYSWKQLWANVEFIGLTENENWGIWGINVWGNQRHLPMGFSILMIVLIAMYLFYLPNNSRLSDLNDPK